MPAQKFLYSQKIIPAGKRIMLVAPTRPPITSFENGSAEIHMSVYEFENLSKGVGFYYTWTEKVCTSLILYDDPEWFQLMFFNCLTRDDSNTVEFDRYYLQKYNLEPPIRLPDGSFLVRYRNDDNCSFVDINIF